MSIVAAQLLILIFVLYQSVQKPRAYTFNGNNAYVNPYAKPVIGEDGFVSLFSDGTNYERLVFYTPEITLPSAAYRLTIRYDSQIDGDYNANFDHVVGEMPFQFSGLSPFLITPSTLRLRDSHQEISQAFIIAPFQNLSGSELFGIRYYNNGTLRLNSLEITEILPYRIIRLASWLSLFVLVDWLYFVIIIQPDIQKKIRTSVILAIILFSSLPLMSDLILSSPGHDLEFHANRILSLAEEIRRGNPFPTLYTTALNGYGYANPLFYGQLFLYLPALLCAYGVPFVYSYHFFMILLNTATCLISYFCFNAFGQRDEITLAGSALYTLSAYRLTNMYIRWAVGELTAMTFFPLVFAGFYLIYRADDKTKIKTAPILCIAFGLSSILFSHMLSIALSAVFILILILMRLRETFCKNRFFALLKAAVLTLLLSLSYLIPFLQSYGMDLNVHHAYNAFSQRGLYPIQLFNPLFYGNQYTDILNSYMKEMPLNLGFSLLLALLAFVIVTACKPKANQQKSYSLAASSFTLSCLALLLSSTLMPWSLIVQRLPWLYSIVQVLQFPWRFLTIASIACAFTYVFALDIFPSHKISHYIGVVAISSLLLNTAVFFNGQMLTCSALYIYHPHEVTFFIGSGEYLPYQTNSDIFRYNELQPADSITLYSSTRDANAFTIACESSGDEGYIDLPLLYYNNYQAADEATDSPLEIVISPEKKLRVLLPENYSGTFHVRYVMPTLWKICNAVSVLTLAGVIGWALRNFKKRRRA